MSDEDLFKETEENSDDIRGRYLKKDDTKEEHKEKDEQSLEEYIEDYFKAFEDILNQIDEEIDKLDSYERTMQVKRSIDRLIETLYSQAAPEDIDIELETTKHTSDKLNSMKRIIEKRKQTIKETLSQIFAQQQKEKSLLNAKQKTADIGEVKAQVKSSIKEVLFSVIGNRMDPKRRAGETAASNEKQAHIYGREAIGGILGALLKTFLASVNAVVEEIVKPLRHTSKQKMSFTKQLEESRNIDEQKGKGRSI